MQQIRTTILCELMTNLVCKKITEGNRFLTFMGMKKI